LANKQGCLVEHVFEFWWRVRRLMSCVACCNVSSLLDIISQGGKKIYPSLNEFCVHGGSKEWHGKQTWATAGWGACNSTLGDRRFYNLGNYRFKGDLWFRGNLGCRVGDLWSRGDLFVAIVKKPSKLPFLVQRAKKN